MLGSPKGDASAASTDDSGALAASPSGGAESSDASSPASMGGALASGKSVSSVQPLGPAHALESEIEASWQAPSTQVEYAPQATPTHGAPRAMGTVRRWCGM